MKNKDSIVLCDELRDPELASKPEPLIYDSYEDKYGRVWLNIPPQSSPYYTVTLYPYGQYSSTTAAPSSNDIYSNFSITYV